MSASHDKLDFLLTSHHTCVGENEAESGGRLNPAEHALLDHECKSNDWLMSISAPASMMTTASSIDSLKTIDSAQSLHASSVLTGKSQ